MKQKKFNLCNGIKLLLHEENGCFKVVPAPGLATLFMQKKKKIMAQYF